MLFRAKQHRAEALSQQSDKRRKLREELEKREKEANLQRNDETMARGRLQQELARLRKKFEDEAAELARQAAAAAAAAEAARKVRQALFVLHVHAAGAYCMNVLQQHLCNVVPLRIPLQPASVTCNDSHEGRTDAYRDMRYRRGDW